MSQPDYTIALAQVDTPTKKLLLGIAVLYMSLVILVPTLNVFFQVSSRALGFGDGLLNTRSQCRLVKTQSAYERLGSVAYCGLVCIGSDTAEGAHSVFRRSEMDLDPSFPISWRRISYTQ